MEFFFKFIIKRPINTVHRLYNSIVLCDKHGCSYKVCFFSNHLPPLFWQSSDTWCLPDYRETIACKQFFRIYVIITLIFNRHQSVSLNFLRPRFQFDYTYRSCPVRPTTFLVPSFWSPPPLPIWYTDLVAPHIVSVVRVLFCCWKWITGIIYFVTVELNRLESRSQPNLFFQFEHCRWHVCIKFHRVSVKIDKSWYIIRQLSKRFEMLIDKKYLNDLFCFDYL